MSSLITRIKPIVPQEFKNVFHRFRNRYVLGLRFSTDITRLNLGCGGKTLDGWANVDFSGIPGVITHDLTKPVPLRDGSIKFIYTEHFIEHITRDQGIAFVRDCHRLLKSGGVLRISTPNLRRIMEDYRKGPAPKWREWDWAPATGCQMVNGAMRLWGHHFVYDHEELELLLSEAGFSRIEKKRWGESNFPELCGLETREYYDDVIVEATKGAS